MIPLDTLAGPFHGEIYIVRNDRGYIIGIESASSEANLSIKCIDSLGVTYWHKLFTGRKVRVLNAVFDEKGNLMLSGFIRGGQDSTYGWLAKMDSSGRIYKETIFNNNHAFCNSICEASKVGGRYFLTGYNDGSYYLSAVKDTSFVWISEVDSSGNILNYKRFLFNPFTKYLSVDLLIERNDYLYGIGTFETTEGWNNFTQYAMLVKLDMQGNLLWKRFFQTWYRDNRAFGISSIPDGFLICGDAKDTTHATGYTDAWLIKTDTNGCIVPGCHLFDGLVQIVNPQAFLKIYPNPAQDFFTVSFDHPGTSMKVIKLYDHLGNKVKEKAGSSGNVKFHTQDLTEGFYYVVVETIEGSQASVKVIIRH